MQTSSNPEPDPTICRICQREPICEGLGVISYDVPVEDPRFGKLFRCPNNPVELDTERQERIRRLSKLDAYRDKNFHDFKFENPTLKVHERSSLQTAVREAMRYADNPRGWLLLEGSYGTGKTHLAAAIGNDRIQRGDMVLFITAPDLLDHLRSTYSPSAESSYDETFERIRSAPFLILDDLGSESPSPWAQEKLFQLFNDRHARQLPTVITTNIDPDRLDPRIRSRLLDDHFVRMVKIVAPDFRTYRPNHHDQLTSLALYNDLTFDNFDTRKKATSEERANLKHAFDVAYTYAQNPIGWLLISAPPGRSKTHLAAAIAHARQDQGVDVLFITVPDLLDYLRVTFNPNAPVTFDERFNMVRNAPFLVLDHLDMEGSSWAKEKLFQILDYRYVTLRPTVITTAVRVDELDERLRVRAMDGRRCSIAGIDAESYAARMKRK